MTFLHTLIFSLVIFVVTAFLAKHLRSHDDGAGCKGRCGCDGSSCDKKKILAGAGKPDRNEAGR